MCAMSVHNDHPMRTDRSLLVIIPDRLSALVEKGEVQPCYYNPGNFFRRIDIVMTNDDRPDEDAVRPMVGTAEVVFHNLPETTEWMGLPPKRALACLERWAQPGIALARRLRPALIRCHGVDFNAFAGACIRQALNIPLVVSVHTNPDESPVRRRPFGTAEDRATVAAYDAMERFALAHADAVLPVYRSALPYLCRMNAPNVQVAYNILNGEALRRKESYRLGQPPHILCAGRQYHEKNPSNLMRAVAFLPGVRLTLVGDGPLHTSLRRLAEELGLAARVDFIPSLPNGQLCGRLPEFDLFAIHSDAAEINKCTLEALLTGLPVIVTRRIGLPVPEFEEQDIVHLTEDGVDAWWHSLSALLADDASREALGRRARLHAEKHWSPRITEAKIVSLYQVLIQ